MRRSYGAFVVMSILAGVVATGTASASDRLEGAWLKRAAAARHRLTQAGLDACDKAYEQAFADPKGTKVGKQPAYEVRFDVAKQEMMAVYVFKGDRLDKFLLVALPPRWMAYQNAHSKTLSVLVAKAKCAFDLCTNNPFVDGACRAPSARRRH